MVSFACPPLRTHAFPVIFSLYYGYSWQSCCGRSGLYILLHCLMVSAASLSCFLIPFKHSQCSWTDLVVLTYSRMVLLSFGIVTWRMWHLHLLCPYCITTPVQLIVTCLVVLLPLYHARSILVVLPQVHVDSFPLAPSSWYLWHVHHFWPVHFMSHSHCIMDHYGGNAVDTCALYILCHCRMISAASLPYLFH